MGELALDDMRRPGNQRSDTPPEWRPRMEVDDIDGGFVVSKPYAPDDHPNYASVLDEFGLDPQAWHIRHVRRSKWQTYDERWLEAVRINVVPAQAETATRVDYEKLTEEIARWRPRTSEKVTKQGAYVSPVGDTQFGKIDGDGSAGTVGRFFHYTERSVQKLRQTVRKGRVGEVVLPWAGDCIEGIWSQGGALRARLDLTVTEQVRVNRRAMWAQLKAFAPYADKITIPVVPGNHDEAIRINNQMASMADDSWAIEAASAVADMVELNEALQERVRFIFPETDDMTVTFNAAGTSYALAHGHQCGRDALRWWSDQAGGRTPVGSADVLVTAHYHHLRVADHGGERLWIQIPALDGGSNWFKHRKGDNSPPRMVSWWTADGRVWGLDPLDP